MPVSLEIEIDEPEEQRLWDEKAIYQRMNEDRERVSGVVQHIIVS